MNPDQNEDETSDDAEERLPGGVRIVPMTCNSDERGSLVEFYREDWPGEMGGTVQWNHVVSRPNVLRGLHVHHVHWDYLYMVQGGMELVDVRRDSPDFKMARVLRLHSERPRGVIIPPGVAHGFYFAEAAVLVYGVSNYWDKEDELGCQWNDAQLEIPWQATEPSLSERDEQAGSFEEMIREYEAASGGTGAPR